MKLADLPNTYTRESVVPVTASAGGSVLLKADPQRIAFTVVNDGANHVRVTRREVPTATRGLPIDANGGVLSEDFEVYGRSVGDERRAIAVTADVTVYVEETLLRA